MIVSAMPNFSTIHIIYNPNSTGDSKSMARQLERELNKAMPKIEIQTVPTKYAGHARELAREIAESEKQPLVISSSGDGGYNEVVNGVMESGNDKAICAVLPAGNANDHSRTMQDRPLSEAIIKGKPILIDLIKVSVKTSGQPIAIRYAHSYVGLGLTPVAATELNRHTLNSFREAVLVVRTFFKYRPFKIRHADKVIRLDSLLFANINQMAKVLTLAKENRPTDGKFEVILFPSKRKWKLIKRLTKAAATSLDTTKRRSKYTFSVIKKMPMQLDGEVMLLKAGSNVTVESAHKTLRTIV
jgi:diacylglycerol kinase (ATP)